MRTFVFLILFLVVGVATPAFAQSGGNGGDGGSTGNGMPGCDGGTNPAADGKFYVPGTHQECNPSDDDRARAQKKSK